MIIFSDFQGMLFYLGYGNLVLFYWGVGMVARQIYSQEKWYFGKDIWLFFALLSLRLSLDHNVQNSGTIVLLLSAGDIFPRLPGQLNLLGADLSRNSELASGWTWQEHNFAIRTQFPLQPDILCPLSNVQSSDFILYPVQLQHVIFALPMWYCSHSIYNLLKVFDPGGFYETTYRARCLDNRLYIPHWRLQPALYATIVPFSALTTELIAKEIDFQHKSEALYKCYGSDVDTWYIRMDFYILIPDVPPFCSEIEGKTFRQLFLINLMLVSEFSRQQIIPELLGILFSSWFRQMQLHREHLLEASPWHKDYHVSGASVAVLGHKLAVRTINSFELVLTGKNSINLCWHWRIWDPGGSIFQNRLGAEPNFRGGVCQGPKEYGPIWTGLGCTCGTADDIGPPKSCVCVGPAWPSWGKLLLFPFAVVFGEQERTL